MPSTRWSMSARLKAMSKASFPARRSSDSATSSRARKAGGETDRVHARCSSKPAAMFWRGWPGSPQAAPSWRPIRHDKDCGFCDYAGICGDVAGVARRKRSQAQIALEHDPDTLRGATRQWPSERLKPEQPGSQRRRTSPAGSGRARSASSASSTGTCWSKRLPEPARRPAWSRG